MTRLAVHGSRGRRRLLQSAAGLLAGIALAGCARAAPDDPPAGATLTLATWNMEWLMEPAVFDELARNCQPRGSRASGSERAIPCDLVPQARRDDHDFERLREFAAGIPADVVALQEVDGAAAAARVFAGHDFCFTARRHVQNVGFAIRKGIPHRCNRDYRALGMRGDDVRWGADVTLYPGSAQEIRLLAVHLKSGCNRDPLTTRQGACHTLQRQVPVLEKWIDARAAEHRPFAVLGDFNRRFDREFAPARDARGDIVAMWYELDDGDPPEADLLDPGTAPPTEACRRQDPVRTPIDHILLSATLGRALQADSYRMWTYPRDDDPARWPDHCLRSVRIDLGALGG